MRIPPLPLGLLLFLAVISPGLAQKQRSFPGMNFTLVTPEGYEPLEAGQVPPGFMAAYTDSDITDAEPDRMIGVQKMGGLLLPNQKLNLNDLPPEQAAMGFTQTTLEWKSHKVDAVEVTIPQGPVKMFSLGVQMPLKPEAIQLNFAGPADQMEEVRQLAREVVASLEGPTNWDDSAPPARDPGSDSDTRASRITSGIGGLAIVIIVVLLVVRLVASSFKGRKR